MSAPATGETLKSTPLHELHLAHKARMVPFAGYDMPVNYVPGIIKEHLHCRAAAGLFDVSHMGQITVRGSDIAVHLEKEIPVDLVGLAPGRQKYGMLLNSEGGILDDLMVMHCGEEWTLVVNAACKDDDLTLLKKRLGDHLQFELLEDRALLAVQGPRAVDALARLTDHPLSDMVFMDVAEFAINGVQCIASRSGYTGEDGFEISIAADQAMVIAEALLADDSVELVGLGARDSLRMEAGLCLYGQDMSPSITPLEAGLGWAISRPRRSGGDRPGGFPGDNIILAQLENGAATTLCGLLPQGKAPMRPGTKLFDADGAEVGLVSSGGFSPTLGRPISIARVDRSVASPGTKLDAEVRGKRLPAETVTMPFVSHHYVK